MPQHDMFKVDPMVAWYGPLIRNPCKAITKPLINRLKQGRIVKNPSKKVRGHTRGSQENPLNTGFVVGLYAMHAQAVSNASSNAIALNLPFAETNEPWSKLVIYSLVALLYGLYIILIESLAQFSRASALTMAQMP